MKKPAVLDSSSLEDEEGLLSRLLKRGVQKSSEPSELRVEY